MPEIDTTSPLEEARRGRPDPWRVGGAPVAGPVQQGFILARAAIDGGLQGVADADVRVVRPWGDEEIWVVYVDPLYGRIAIPLHVASRVGLITIDAAQSVAAPPEAVRAEAVAKANSEEQSIVVERRARKRIMGDGLAGDLADSAGEFLGGALGVAASGASKVLESAFGAVVKATPAVGWVVLIVGAVVVVHVTKARG